MSRLMGFRIIPSCDCPILHRSSAAFYTCTCMVLILDICWDLESGKLLILNEVRTAEAFILQEPWNEAKSWTWPVSGGLLHPFVGIVVQLSPWTFQKRPRVLSSNRKIPCCQHTFCCHLSTHIFFSFALRNQSKT